MIGCGNRLFSVISSMRNNHADPHQASLASHREQWQRHRDERSAFEGRMDINSCEDHRALAHLSRLEAQSERDLRAEESRILEIEARRFRIFGFDVRKLLDWWRGLLSRSPTVSS
jgi:hypothetical protein